MTSQHLKVQVAPKVTSPFNSSWGSGWKFAKDGLLLTIATIDQSLAQKKEYG